MGHMVWTGCRWRCAPTYSEAIAPSPCGGEDGGVVDQESAGEAGDMRGRKPAAQDHPV